METRADGVRVAYPLFQAEGDGSTPISALQLRIEGIGYRDAKALNRLWHSRLPMIRTPTAMMATGSRCYGAEFGGLWYAVAIWMNPLARMLPSDGSWLELRRMAVAPDAPPNTASRMLGIMARIIHKECPAVTRLISYQDTAVHTGGIYKAAGWTATRLSEGGEWNRPSRYTPAVQSGAPKQRWEKVIR